MSQKTKLLTEEFEFVGEVREMWLCRNSDALAMVREGLAQAAKGELHDLGHFDKFADDEIE